MLFTFINSLTLGMAVFLIATGLTLIFGIMRILNFAHGACFMMGAYISSTILGDMPGSVWALIGAALIAMAISLDDFIIAVFTLGGGNTLSTFIWGKVRTTLDPSINAIACILLAFTVGTTLMALKLTKYRG